MYTVSPSTAPSLPSYARGLGFIAATQPLMMGATWLYGKEVHTLLFASMYMGLIPLCLIGWPIAVAYGQRQWSQRYRNRRIYGLAAAAPIGYMALLISGDLLGGVSFREMVFVIGFRLFQSSFRLNVGTWLGRWLEIGIAWAVVLTAVIYTLRRWSPEAG